MSDDNKDKVKEERVEKMGAAVGKGAHDARERMLKKSQKQGIGLSIGAIGILIIGATSLTNTNNWLWISISAILIIGGSIYWFLNK